MPLARTPSGAPPLAHRAGAQARAAVASNGASLPLWCSAAAAIGRQLADLTHDLVRRAERQRQLTT